MVTWSTERLIAETFQLGAACGTDWPLHRTFQLDADAYGHVSAIISDRTKRCRPMRVILCVLLIYLMLLLQTNQNKPRGNLEKTLEGSTLGG